jgi:hypothetical protein
VGPDRLFDRVVNCCHSWCPSGLRVSCCQVITLVRFKLARVSAIPSDIGHDGSILLSVVAQVLVVTFCVQVLLLFFPVIPMMAVSGSPGF